MTATLDNSKKHLDHKVKVLMDKGFYKLYLGTKLVTISTHLPIHGYVKYYNRLYKVEFPWGDGGITYSVDNSRKKV